MQRVTLSELNTMDAGGFTAALGDIFEHSPWVAEAAAPLRPFASLAALHGAMVGVVRDCGAERQLTLLRAHPDLAGKAARAGALTADSTAEQASAGLDQLSEGEFAAFQRLNPAYLEKFGFPFIICARRHTKSSILRQFERRLANDAATEQATALAEVARIVALRLDQRVEAPERLKVTGRLSTHVLDTTLGKPAAGVPVELFEVSDEGVRRLIARRITNADGRTDTPLIHERPLPIGTYELCFSIGGYFAGSGAQVADPPFLDLVPLRFAIAEPEAHYHVPLLATPWSFTTYRGS